MRDLVSIIIPVYQVEEYLPRCVSSVRNQSYRDLEIILVDDGSLDGSGLLCDSYGELDSRVRVIHQENQGLSCARNVGLGDASGAVVMFLDGDDWLAEDAVEAMLEAMCESAADIVACGTCWTYGDESDCVDRADSGLRSVTGDEALSLGSKVLSVNVLSACGKLLSREILGDAPFPVGRLHEDVFVTHQWWHRAEVAVLLFQRLHYYRQRPGSITWGEPSLRSMNDKALAHLTRAEGLMGMGLLPAALADFKIGFSWSLRAVGETDRHARGDYDEDLSAQRRAIAILASSVPLARRMWVAVRAYRISPRVAGWVYSRGLRLVRWWRTRAQASKLLALD